MASTTKLLEDCKIVWLCPLEIELRAAIAMLDSVFEDIPSRARGQNVIYTIGKIASHTVAVVGYYQEHGLGVSGSMAAEVLRDLPNLEMGLLVGIAGGIPSPTRDIRLGDVAVAVPEGDRPGVVGYDLGRAGDNGTFELKHWQNATHPLLRSIINIIRAHGESKFRRHLRVTEDRPEFQIPGSPPYNGEWSPTQGSQVLDHPAVHYGTILSGNSVIKSKEKRDHLRDKYHGIAVEMEAAGMMTRLPVAVIRGISDFADSEKNDTWQPYAAITAAAYAKEVLTRLPSYRHESPTTSPLVSTPSTFSTPPSTPLLVQPSTPFSDQDVRLADALPESWAFVGRDEELGYLEEELGFQAQRLLQKSTVGLWGLSGVGKSQLAASFVRQQRFKHPEREIFWVNGESQEAFEQSVISMLKASHSPIPSESVHPAESSDEQRMRLVNLFFAELGRLEGSNWLLVVDGINDKPHPIPKHPVHVQFNIHNFLARLKRGYILLTARRRDVVEDYHLSYEVKGLKDSDAIKLLQLKVSKKLLEEGDVRELVTLLKGLPLALRLAVSSISRYRYTVAAYVKEWKKQESNGELLGGGESLSQSMELSFKDLETENPTAAKLLTLFSFLDHRDLWYDLCLGARATNDLSLGWLRHLAARQTPFRGFYPILADLSFIELKSCAGGRQIWETHPAIQVVAKQRAIAYEQEYISSAISLVAVQVPRSYEADFWERMRRLEPHVNQCWSYIEQGRWGPNTNLLDLESLGRVFRHLGRYERAALIYRMIKSGLGMGPPSIAKSELLADVFTNLGLVRTGQRQFNRALQLFQSSLDLRRKLGILTPDAAMSILYNKAVVFVMVGSQEEAETRLRIAANYFSVPSGDLYGFTINERNRLHIRILKDIGELLLQKDSAYSAAELFKQILDSPKRVLGPSHPTIVSVKLNLGRAYVKLDQFTAARGLLREVIAVYTEWWGEYHPDTMRAVDELALAFMKEGEKKEGARVPAVVELQTAERLWKQVLSFYRDTYGDGSDIAHRVESNLRCLRTLTGKHIKHTK
ncbi:hypothetical protein TWF718_001929 [Orbilia javanica]|uniref:Uncharacterized protein n=1 Tax=Orbilia javanica TaxID=47235 RepID=A0AAN8N1J0_9PEZI